MLFIFVYCDGKLYGCGVVDMKMLFVVFVVVFEEFVVVYFDYCGVIVFLIMSDEEGLVIDGIVKVVELL